MNLKEAVEQVKAGKRVARPSEPHDLLYLGSKGEYKKPVISQAVWCSFRALTKDEEQAIDWEIKGDEELDE